MLKHPPMLVDLFRQYGTDKELNWNYQHIYPLLFPLAFRETVRMVLEVGIGTLNPDANSTMYGGIVGYRPGASLRVWRDYFPYAQVHGLDIEPDTQFDNEDRIYTHLCNSTVAQQVSGLLGNCGPAFDVMIDDGSHWPNDQLATFRSLFPYLRPGGVYAAEDCLQESWKLFQAEAESRYDIESIFGGNLTVIKKMEYPGERRSAPLVIVSSDQLKQSE